MFKAKFLIPIITGILLMTSGISFSQETAGVNKSGFRVNLIAKDRNPKSHLFKLFDSHKTEFENTTIIKFELGEAANVLLTVCDLEGKTIATLIDDLMEPGVYNMNYKSESKITPGELTYKLEIKGVSGVKNVFAVK